MSTFHFRPKRNVFFVWSWT